jgi:hypothetical protein
MVKTISVIGKGTAGCLNALRFTNLGYDVKWYCDSSTPTTSVGEGSDLSLSRFLAENTDLNYDILHEIEGHYKEGIRKDNWGKKDFTHGFNLGTMALHFTATSLHSYIQNLLQDIIIDKKVKHEDLDSDYIIDCTGTPIVNLDDFNIAEYVPVNKAYVVQCPWDSPKFNYSLCVARPYGWVFGIPLKDRCSVGYMFNSNITDVVDIEKDIEVVLATYGLSPNRCITPKTIEFSNYYRKENFTDKVAYNGNSSFFLEPIEATSIYTIIQNIRLTEDILNKDFTPEMQNVKFHNIIKETQDIIMLHYLAGSKWENEFWKKAKKEAIDCFKNTFLTYPKSNLILGSESVIYSTWDENSFKQNLIGLELHKKLAQIKND